MPMLLMLETGKCGAIVWVPLGRSVEEAVGFGDGLVVDGGNAARGNFVCDKLLVFMAMGCSVRR